MVSIKVRHLHKLKGRWYWIPSRSAKALGFASEALGTDLRAATIRAEELNRQLDAERAKTRRPVETVAAGTVAALIRLYKESPEFLDLREKTRRDYGNIMKRIEAAAGAVEVSSITRAKVINTYAKLRKAHSESMAAAIMRVWKVLLSFAHNAGWRPDNPATKMKLRTLAPRRRVWTPEEVAAFCRAAKGDGRDSMALAVELAYDIGQRQGDILRLTWTQYDGSTFTLTQSKTSQPVVAAVSSAMQQRLSQVKRTGVQVVISETTGRPYQQSHFVHEFARLRDLAGMPKDLQFRDLRRTAATEMGQAGATDDQLRAQTGHRSRNVVAVYVVPDRAMSEEAQRRREAWQKKQAGNGESKPDPA